MTITAGPFWFIMRLTPVHGYLRHQIQAPIRANEAPIPANTPTSEPLIAPDPSVALVPLESQDENPPTDSQDSPKEGSEGRSVLGSQVRAQDTPDEGTHQARWQSQNNQPADRPNQTADEQSEDETEHLSKSEPVHRSEKGSVPQSAN